MPDINVDVQIKAKADQVFDALTQKQHLSAWWTPNAQEASSVGMKAKFDFQGADFYCVMEVMKLEPIIEWVCLEAGNRKNQEWVGTIVVWTIKDNQDGTTSLSVLHKDWADKTELYSQCQSGWKYYLDSLKEYLETGKGKPYGS